MRLLCLTSRLPWPADRGDRLRAVGFFSRWASEHELTLVSAVSRRTQLEDGALPRGWFEEVRRVRIPPWRSRLQAALAAAMPGRLPLQCAYYRDRRLLRTVDDVLAHGSFDGVYCHLFRMAQYLEGRSIPRIVDLTDVVSSELAASVPYRHPLRRPLYASEARRVAAYEARLAASADEIWVISQAERLKLLERAPEARVQVVPNGADCERSGGPVHRREPGRLLFVGRLDVAHNLDAVRYLVDRILPRIRAVAPGASLRVVGRGLTGRERRRLARVLGVTAPGFVDDLEAELGRAQALVAPLRFGAGVQNKALEAMACGLPVVTTPPVARGLEARHDEHLLVASDAPGIAAETLRLLADPELSRRLAEAARRHVCQRFRWRISVERLRRLEPAWRATS